MPANLTGAFTDKKRRLGGLERQAAERRAALRARKNISGGNVGGTIGGIAGTAVALFLQQAQRQEWEKTKTR